MEQQHPPDDAQDVPSAVPDAIPASDAEQDATLATLSPFDVQLCLFLLWWMQQQQHAQEEVPPPEAPLETIIVDSVFSSPDVEREENLRGMPSRWSTRRKAFALAAGSFLCLVALAASLLGFVFTAPASVTIIPTQTTLSTSESITINTAESSSLLNRQTIPGRLLSTLTLSQATTVTTTGMGQQAAQVAHGQVTFYNAALGPQTIPAGTLLTGSDGVQVVTDQEAVLPIGTPPSEGQVTIPAHAVQVGPAGNISTDDLDSPCCREYVLVRNSTAFHGGQDARTYPMVTQHDLNSAVATLTTTLDQSVQAAYAAQLSPGEELVTPVGCTPHVSSSQQVGQEARHLTVILADICTGIAYDQQTLQTILVQRMTTQAHKQLEPGYSLLGELQVHILRADTALLLSHSMLTLTVQTTGVWAYQFTETDLQRLGHLIAGKSQQEATALLLHQPGVGEVVLSSGTLPADPQRIRVLVLYRLV